MKTADEQYKQGFFEELQAFRERVQTRAKQKVEDAVKQYEEVRSFPNQNIELQSNSFSGRTTKASRSWWFRSD